MSIVRTLVVGMAFWLTSCIQGDKCSEATRNSLGVVSDEKTAIGIAEAVLVPVFGDDVIDHRPFRAELQDSVWVVRGRKTSSGKGEVPVVVIGVQNACIYDLYHEK